MIVFTLAKLISINRFLIANIRKWDVKDGRKKKKKKMRYLEM